MHNKTVELNEKILFSRCRYFWNSQSLLSNEHTCYALSPQEEQGE